jgi:hypothetical protein
MGTTDCKHGDAVYWNLFNQVVQCHRCGQVFAPLGLTAAQAKSLLDSLDGEWGIDPDKHPGIQAALEANGSQSDNGDAGAPWRDGAIDSLIRIVLERKLPESSAPPPTFLSELTHLINRYSLENESDTPDFILAQYLRDALTALGKTLAAREKWYGRGKDSSTPNLG